jgi:hypothetical protein
MRHYLDDAGRVAEMPGPALNLALFLGAIVAWVTSGRAAGDTRTNVPCRRSPDRRRCDGEIVASFDSDGNAIIWHCPICCDYGVTHGWQGLGGIERHGLDHDDEYLDGVHRVGALGQTASDEAYELMQSRGRSPAVRSNGQNRSCSFSAPGCCFLGNPSPLDSANSSAAEGKRLGRRLVAGPSS